MKTTVPCARCGTLLEVSTRWDCPQTAAIMARHDGPHHCPTCQSDMEDDQLLKQHELIKALGITRYKFDQMKALGFPMPLGMNTKRAALEWIQLHAERLTRASSGRRRRSREASGR